MKVKTLTTSLLLAVSFQFFLQNSYAKCHIEDWVALKALYENTDGKNWLTQTGWEAVGDIAAPAPSCDLNALFGVSLNDSGRVNSIDLDGVDDGQLTFFSDNTNSGNNLRGSIPGEISKLSDLTLLNLAYNRLSGSIPAEIGMLYNLIELDLPINQLTGNIPAQLGDLANLKILYLYENLLDGNIPDELGALSNLTDLNLSNNKLTGTIPSELGQLTRLINLNLSFNKLTGNIPPELSKLSFLKSLWLNDNMLTGTISTDFGKLNSLESLILNDNMLTGSIPSFLGELRNLHTLLLHNNNFSDAMPSFSGSLELNIQNNLFTCSDIPDDNFLIKNFTYQPQSSLDFQGEVFDSIPIGSSLNIANYESLFIEDNLSFQWTKNGDDIKNANNATYNIDFVEADDAGIYVLEVTFDNCAPEFTLTSEPIFVVVYGYDLKGGEVEVNQVLIEFGDSVEKRMFEDSLSQNTIGFTIIESCNCNRELYLYEFDNAQDAVIPVIDDDVAVVRPPRDPDMFEISGGVSFNNIVVNESEPVSSVPAFKVFSEKFGDALNDEVTIYLLDTGLDTTFFNNSNFLTEAPIDSCFQFENPSFGFGFDTTFVTTDFRDTNGHGTFGFNAMTEYIQDNGNLKIVPLKIGDTQGKGTLFDMVCAIYHAIDQDADIINISASYQGEFSPVLDNAIELARQKEIYIVASAGNDTINIDSIPVFPAFFAGRSKIILRSNESGDIISETLKNFHVISTAAISAPNDQGMAELCEFSNFGKQSVRIATFGENLLCLDIKRKVNMQTAQSGTSLSAFYTTKAFALELGRDKNRKPDQIWEDFKNNWLIDNLALNDITMTGKQINFDLLEAPESCASIDIDTSLVYDVLEIDTTFVYDIEQCFNTISLIECNGNNNINSCAPISVPPPSVLSDFIPSNSMNFHVEEETVIDKYFSTTTYTYNFSDEAGNKSTCQSQYRIVHEFLQKPVVSQPTDICEGDLWTSLKIGTDQYKIYADNDGIPGEELSTCNTPGLVCSTAGLGVDTSMPGKHNFWITTFINFPDDEICESEATLFSVNIQAKPVAGLITLAKNLVPGEFINLMDMVETNKTGYWSGNNIIHVMTINGENIPYFSSDLTGSHKLYYTVKNGNCESNYPLIVDIVDEVVIINKERGALNLVDYRTSETIKNDEFDIYPNPTSIGKIFFDFKGNAKENRSYTVFNIGGQALLKGELKSNSAIDFHHLSKGLYIIEVQGKSIKKLVIE